MTIERVREALHTAAILAAGLAPFVWMVLQ